MALERPARPRLVVPRRPTQGPLTLAECRELLGAGCRDSDDEIRHARDALTELARALLETRHDR
jgi:hypothetical protein